jgi:integrase
MPAFWQSMNGHDDMSAQALKLTILTGVRTANAIQARWSEFDLEKNTWLIPAEKMKADEEHEVPLSKAVLSLLAEIPRLPSGYLFEGKIAGKPPSNLTMLMKCRGLHETKHKEDGIGWIDKKGNVITVHGFRSTFRDWAAEKTTVANIVAEKALAHTVSSDAEAAYRRGQLLERRRKLMESWAGYVTQPAQQKVVSISGERVI